MLSWLGDVELTMNALLQQYAEDGYHVASGIIPPSLATAARVAYETLVKDLASISAAELGGELRAFDSAEAALAHLIEQRPLLTCCHFRAPEAVHSIWYRKSEVLPSFYLPEAFAIATNPQILDAVATLLETNEISWSPIFYCNIKYSTESIGPNTILPLDFLFGPTHIHCDMQVAREETFANQIVNVWVPLTSAGTSNGTLCVMPRSHTSGPYPFDLFRTYGWTGDETSLPPQELVRVFNAERTRVLEHATPLEVSPGDAVLLDYSLYHGSWPFERATRAPEMRMALNFRYFKTGTPCGLVGLPSFAVRSANASTVVPGPHVWATTMERAIREQLERPERLARRADTPIDLAQWLSLGRDQRGKSRSFPTADKNITARVRIGDRELAAGPAVAISFGALSMIAPRDLTIDPGQLVKVDITAPDAKCSLNGRAYAENDTLWIDVLDVPLAAFPSRTEHAQYHKVLAHAGETLALTNPRNLPLVRRSS
jgi:hypothetical protein